MSVVTKLGGYLPPKAREMNIKRRTLSFRNEEERLDVSMPCPTLDQVREIMQIIKSSEIQTMSVLEIVSAISKTVHILLDRNHPSRKKAEKYLPMITGYDEEIIRLGLTQSLQTFRKHELLRSLEVNFHNWNILDQFIPSSHGGYTKAIPPQLSAHIWAGNVPALPLWSTIASLLVKGGLLGKVSSSEPFFIGLFCEILSEIEPRLANSMAIVSWKGGDEEREKVILSSAEVVAAYGTNKTIVALKKQASAHTHFIEFGNKLSFGYLHHQVLDNQKADELAKRAALDVIRYDQQGCFSPHTFFVERGGKTTPEEWAERLARKLQIYQEKYPLGELSINEAEERVRWCNEKEWQAETRLIVSPKNEWIVAYSEEDSLEPSPISRVVTVVAIDSYHDMLTAIQGKQAILQTVEIAAPTEILFDISLELSSLGINRITSIGKATTLHAGWHQDGYSLLREFTKYVDISPEAIAYSEKFNKYTD